MDRVPLGVSVRLKIPAWLSWNELSYKSDTKTVPVRMIIECLRTENIITNFKNASSIIPRFLGNVMKN